MTKCNSWEEYIGLTWDHSCEAKEFLSSDDPMKRVLGFCCVTCDSYWGLSLVDLRRSWSEDQMTPFIELMKTTLGRIELAKILTHGNYLYLWDEVEDA